MRLPSADQVFPEDGINSKTFQKSKSTGLEEALELAGDGVFRYLVIAASGINLMAAFMLTICMAYVLPAASCDLKLTTTEKGILASMSFTGMIFSSHLFGFLSDNFGRRYVVVRCSAVSAMLCVMASFSPTTSLLEITWFANGFVIAGAITPIYVLVSEYCAFKHRTKALLLSSAISSLGGVLLPCMAWWIIPLDIQIPLVWGLRYTSWRLFLALPAVPLLLGVTAFMFILESPKYLLSKGYKLETLQVLRKMYAINTNKKAEEYPVEDVCLDASDDLCNMSDQGKGILRIMFEQTCLLFKPPLLSYMIVSCATNLGLVGAYNIIMLWLPENISKMKTYEILHFQETPPTLCEVLINYEQFSQPDIQLELLNGIGNKNGHANATQYYYNTAATCEAPIDRDVYFVNIIIGIVQFFMFGISSRISDITGRKPIIVLFTLLASVSSLAMNFVNTSYAPIFLGAILLLVGAALPIAISIIVDFFPTHVRSMATCICMIFGRAGASAGSQLFAILQSYYCELSYYGLAGFLIVIGVLCLLIPLKK